ncbi:Rrf2 family transcriptional regulator [Patescibacteria group bacterium]|nr:Rrf2 family transcriptional regulator [Patescibacteria group bacterium]
MKIPRQEHVGLLFMGELCRRTGEKPLPLSSVAREHGVSVLFLKKIASRLKAAGLVVSREGIGGGYELAKPADRISVWDIMQALDTDLRKKPEQAASSSACPLYTACLPQHIRRTVNGAVAGSLGTITLEHLVRTV